MGLTTCWMHRPVSGFGGMSDSLVCAVCGLDKYPEVFPINRWPAVDESDPDYAMWRDRAIAARAARQSRSETK